MRKIILSASFFLITPVVVFISIFFLLFLSFNAKSLNISNAKNLNQAVAFVALPLTESVLGDSVISKDARIEIVRQFFAQYKSPLEPFALNIVDEADKYGVDYRLLPAIAMQESNLCKKIIAGSYNCWGFGIYGTTVTKFENYPEAIETITRTLYKNYVAQGLVSPEEIMRRYTPSSNGSWADGVYWAQDQITL